MIFPAKRSRYAQTAWFACLTLWGGIWAYYRNFTGFSAWDDEGSMMASVKQFLDGFRLYDQVWSGYGPVYYFYNWLLRSITGTPVTHDVVRISSLLPWLLTSLACAWIILRFTRSLLLASVGHLAVLYTLRFFTNEPGHPQEICIFLLVCFIASGLLLETRRRILGLALLGLFPAALLLIKINIGIFAILAIGLSLCFHLKDSLLSRIACYSLAMASLLLPFTLMRHQLNDPAASVYCLLVISSLMALFIILLGGPRESSLAIKDCAVVLASFSVTFVGIVLLTIMLGSSIHAMLLSLLLLHLRISVTGLWYIPAFLSPKAIPWAICGVVIAVFFALPEKRRHTRIRKYLLPLKLLFGIGILATYFSTNRTHLFEFDTPFCWLVLYSPSENETYTLTFPRTLLCTASVIQTLYAYPVAGSQIAFIQIVLMVAVFVCVGDCFLWYRTKYAMSLRQAKRLRLANSLALLLLGLGYLNLAYFQRRYYESLSPLDLPGAGRIHLERRQAADYQWLTMNLRNYCDIFVGLPNIPSLNFWASMEPPARMTSDAWTLVLTDSEQVDIVTALSKHAKACAIYNPEILSIWDRNHRDLSGLPLVHYMKNNFKPVGSMDNYFFLVRKERDLAKIPAL